jgi:hypothetical protein
MHNVMLNGVKHLANQEGLFDPGPDPSLPQGDISDPYNSIH